MPIFRFAAIAGGLLVALLFVADAMLKPHEPLFTNNSEGLTRSEPARTQTAQRTPEAPRKQDAKRTQEVSQARAPALVPETTSQPVAAAKPVAPPIAEIGEAVESPPAAAQADTEVVTYPELPKPQPVKTEPANTEVAKTEVAQVEVAKPAPAKTQVAKTEAPKIEALKTQPTRTEPAKAEPAKIDTAKLEAGVTEPAKSESTGREAVTVAPKETQREAARTSSAPKMHKQLARKPERGSRYAAYRDGQTGRDGVPTVDNGYPYGVAPGRARAERQQSWGGEYGQGRYRF